ncbi:MAG TPA: hypothetical protein VK196_05655 [Magnetospirillum sp.]|nr:hypothetical protein [Magnetospirillum sp.]
MNVQDEISAKEKRVYAGVHPGVDMFVLDSSEKTIARNLSRCFYITKCLDIQIGNSEYKYMFVKLCSDMAISHGIKSEIIVLFSPFDNFEPRTLDAIETIHNAHSGFRLDKICAFVISKDKNFVSKLETIIRTQKESRVITPFTYDELIASNDDSFYRDRIRSFFFERNLFDFDSPLKKDTYFFGREAITHQLVEKHLSGENGALFGLRRSGKTSILFSVSRMLQARGGFSVIIDCEALHLNRWWMALYYVVDKINKSCPKSININESRYTEEHAAIEFERDISRLKGKVPGKILIIFDEIEQITFGVSFSSAWKNGGDFVKFWHMLRAVFQSKDGPLTFIIAGTNPRCLEVAFVDGGDNPLYGQITPVYIDGFDVDQTKKMVGTLASYMGMHFDEEIYAYLKREFGGHPFLIRQACSYIKGKIAKGASRRVDRLLYQEAVYEFNSGFGAKFCEMVIGVLSEHYKDEYTMLSYLARGDVSDFNELAESDPAYTLHLLGYGVLEKVGSGYDFKIDAIKTYMEGKEKYQRLNLNNDEKLSEIGSRRNNVEGKLRKMVRQCLISSIGEDELKRQMLSKHDEKKRRRYATLSVHDLFDPDKHEIYFDDLRELMRKNWDATFRNIFSDDVEKFNSRMVLLNSVGRSDAHKKDVKDHDMQTFRGAMTWLEEKINDYFR